MIPIDYITYDLLMRILYLILLSYTYKLLSSISNYSRIHIHTRAGARTHIYTPHTHTHTHTYTLHCTHTHTHTRARARARAHKAAVAFTSYIFYIVVP